MIGNGSTVTAEGKLLTVDLMLTIRGVAIQVAGTVEVLDIAKPLPAVKENDA